MNRSIPNEQYIQEEMRIKCCILFASVIIQKAMKNKTIKRNIILGSCTPCLCFSFLSCYQLLSDAPVSTLGILI